MKATVKNNYIEFEINEGWKSNSFKIKMPKILTFELANVRLVFSSSADNSTVVLNHMTKTQANSIIKEFLGMYKRNKHPFIYKNSIYTILIDAEDDIKLTIKMEAM